MHNFMIFDILDKNNNSIIKKEYTAGYDDPSDYLPKDVIDALKEEFPYHDYCTDKLEEELNNKLTEEIR